MRRHSLAFRKTPLGDVTIAGSRKSPPERRLLSGKRTCVRAFYSQIDFNKPSIDDLLPIPIDFIRNHPRATLFRSVTRDLPQRDESRAPNATTFSGTQTLADRSHWPEVEHELHPDIDDLPIHIRQLPKQKELHSLRELCLVGVPGRRASRRDRGLLGNTEQMLNLCGRMREDSQFRSCAGAIRLFRSNPNWIEAEPITPSIQIHLELRI
jgi:hypothetical protein